MTGPDIWEEVVRCRKEGQAAALATIITTLGSTPGKDPMKMLVRSDGTFVGSVGGGCLEAEVWEHAQEVMASLQPRTVTFSLTEKDYPDSGLICGGQVTVFLEPVTLPVVRIFGAGHVGLATANLAATSGFRVVVYDDRPDMVSSDRFSDGVSCVGGPYEEIAAEALAGDFNLVIVVTRGHQDDERVLRALLATGRSPTFLGMIGSQAKRTLMTKKLKEEGFLKEALDTIVTPVGVSIGARTAPEIAVSIVAQLIQLCRSDGKDAETPFRGRASGATENSAGTGDLGSQISSKAEVSFPAPETA